MEGENLLHKVAREVREHAVAHSYPILYIHSYKFKKLIASGARGKAADLFVNHK